MSRHRDNKTKEEILEKVLIALSQNGLNDLSLRDIAREVGVSARMLIYHFESYETLINSIFINLSIKHKNIFNKFLTEDSGKSFGGALLISSETILADENRNSMLLFIELYTKALRDVEKYNTFLNEVLYNWIKEIESIITKKYGIESAKYATIIVSFYRGILLDWLTGNDKKRILESSRLFTALLDNIFVK